MTGSPESKPVPSDLLLLKQGADDRFPRIETGTIKFAVVEISDAKCHHQTRGPPRGPPISYQIYVPV